MGGLVSYLDRVLYLGFGDNWDDALFRERILARLSPEAVILDLGAGGHRRGDECPRNGGEGLRGGS